MSDPILETDHRSGDGQQVVPQLFGGPSNPLQHTVASPKRAAANGQTGSIPQNLQHTCLPNCQTLVRTEKKIKLNSFEKMQFFLILDYANSDPSKKFRNFFQILKIVLGKTQPKLPIFFCIIVLNTQKKIRNLPSPYVSEVPKFHTAIEKSL